MSVLTAKLSSNEHQGVGWSGGARPQLGIRADQRIDCVARCRSNLQKLCLQNARLCAARVVIRSPHIGTGRTSIATETGLISALRIGYSATFAAVHLHPGERSANGSLQ